jgi:hypothetical protein
MADTNFQNVFDTLKQGVVELAKTTGTQYVTQAEADGQSFLDSSKADLQNWMTELANGSLSKDDFTDLLLGQKDLFELTALKQAGMAAIALDTFKNGVFDLIEKTVFALL